jgi:hypothetical protein
MSKYVRVGAPRQTRPPNAGVHPIWRGIGCLMIVIVPLMSFAGSYLFVRENFKQHWVAIPDLLLQYFELPFLGRVYYADLALTVFLMILGFGLVFVFYSLVYSLVGPPRYGPLDAPPPKRRARKLR